MTGQFEMWFRLPRKSQGSFTCRKSATWDRRLYFRSEGRRAVEFFARKIRRLRPGLNPRSWVPEASMLTWYRVGEHRCERVALTGVIGLNPGWELLTVAGGVCTSRRGSFLSQYIQGRPNKIFKASCHLGRQNLGQRIQEVKIKYVHSKRETSLAV
jgi:hypothetical protein